MAVTNDDLRSYLHLPPDSAEDLTIYIAAAQTKARAAGIPEYRYNYLYDMFILNLAAMYYENRGLAFSGSYQATAEENARKLINAFVLELRHMPKEGAAT